MGLSYEEISKLIDFKELSKGLENVHAIQLQVPKPPNFDYGEEFKCIREKKQREEAREIEDNQNIKGILEENKNLVSLNRKLLEKTNSLDDTLKFLNSTFEDKVDFDKGKMQEQTALLLQLITIMDSKDKDKLKNFMSNIGSPLFVWALTKYFEMKFGIS